MGKTVRRKNVGNRHGYYEWKDEVRQRHGAGDRYFHSDMPSRRGRWAHTFPVKDEANTGRRAEARTLAYKALYSDPENIDTQTKDQKVKHSDRWHWD